MSSSSSNIRPKINLPLNFSASNSLVTTKVPHYATKDGTAVSIVPGLSRPLANGIDPNQPEPQKSNGANFKPRPIKHWRRQLRPSSFGGIVSSGGRVATIQLASTPGGEIYRANNNCTCADASENGGNAYTISEKFTKQGENSLSSSTLNSGTIIENDGYVQIGNPAETPGTDQNYQILTGIYNTKCISCTPPARVIKTASTLLSRAYYTTHLAYMKSRTNTYDQKLLTIPINAPGFNYYNANGELNWPSNSATGSQVYATTDQYNPKSTLTCDGRKNGITIFKPNNRQYACQGAVDSSTRIDRLKQTAVNKNAASLRAAFGSEGASACAYRGISDTPYFLKSKYQPPICSQKNLGAVYRQNKTICNDFFFFDELTISQINGLRQVSAYNNLEVTTRGVVTVKTNTGFYLQDGVNTDSGSAGIFVSTGAGSYYLNLVSIGDLIKISGKVFEFGFTNQLPITQITSVKSLEILSRNNSLPTPVNIGKNYNNVPSLVIDNGNINDYDQYAYAIDYWENYESMLVRIDSPQVIGQLKSLGNFAVVLDMDNPNRIRTTYGGVILQQNGNADIIQIYNGLMPSNPVFYNVFPGDSISYITGVVTYRFGYYYILPRNIADIGVIQRGEISTDLLASTSTTPPAYVNQQALTPLATPHISIITQNMYNMTIKPNEQRMAKYARENLLSPEIIFMQEIQDDSGLTNNGVVTSNFNLDYLINLLNDPTYNVPPYNRNYAYVYIPPDNNQDGGAFAGNIRVVILYDTLTMSIQNYYRIGLSTSTPAPSSTTFQNSRKPLYVNIKHNATNQIYHLIGIHANSKSGDTSLWGSVQPPNEVSEAQRVDQFTYVKNWITSNLNNSVDNIIVAGDCNDYEWSQSVEVLDNNTPSRFMKNLVNDVNYSERYSFYFNGTYQVLDNMFISPSLYNKITSVFNTNVNIPNKPYIKFSDVLSCQFWIEKIGEPILTDHNTLCARIPL